jgi:hypothetical protein
MTRTAYAQLVGQKFFPPKAFGIWKDTEGTKAWRWRDVGMKIVSATWRCISPCSSHFVRLSVSRFSIRRVKARQMPPVQVQISPVHRLAPFLTFTSCETNFVCIQAEAKKDALRRNPEYIKYIQNLVSADYFKGEMEGSAFWKAYESRAADIFVETRREEYVPTTLALHVIE